MTYSGLLDPRACSVRGERICQFTHVQIIAREVRTIATWKPDPAASIPMRTQSCGPRTLSAPLLARADGMMKRTSWRERLIASQKRLRAPRTRAATPPKKAAMRKAKREERVRRREDWVGSPTARQVRTMLLPVWFDAKVW